MLRPIEREESPQALLHQPAQLGASEPIVAAIDSSDFESSLPRDHPQWVKDTLTVSSRARALIATLKPVALRIRGFWDHRLRSISVGGLRLGVDPSGSYCLR
jgi:hypothetical protein